MSKGRKFLVFLVLTLVVGAGGVYLYFAEGEQPRISVSPAGEFINARTELVIEVEDRKSGLASVSVRAVQKERSAELLRAEPDPGKHAWRETVSLAEEGFEDGGLRLEVTAVDRSWTGFFQGNRASRAREFTLDTEPPEVYLETFRHNLNRGGTGLVAFRTKEAVREAGVRIGDFFFPAYERSENVYTCLFSFPYNVDPEKGRPVISVADRAGNERETGFRYHVNDKRFASAEARVSDRFLRRKMGQFREQFPDVEDRVQLFLKVNRELRSRNRQRLIEIGRRTAPEPLWNGRFLRQPNAARRSAFGVSRRYVYNGKVIDRQTHLGVDLASVARADVPASNSGKVVHAGWMGIYGLCVIVDHGLGLQTLYGHLSNIEVQEGARVEKGQTIGNTGASGLAGGDHLHFAVLVSGVPVNPVEWWDTNWIENNIQSKLPLADRTG
jgi:murein DD-endopeptidase MepM/ murein hydrolase activator NlpD